VEKIRIKRGELQQIIFNTMILKRMSRSIAESGLIIKQFTRNNPQKKDERFNC
jgi:hypothetical protein